MEHRVTRVVRVATILVVLGAAVALPGVARAAPPANDNFASAAAISSLPFTDAVDTSEATTEPFEADNFACYQIEKSVWYSIVPSESGSIRADLSGSSVFYTNVRAYRQGGSGPSGLSFLGCANPGYNGLRAVTFAVEAGATYYIQAGSSFGMAGNLQLSVQLVPRPANDDFASATAVGGLPFSHSIDTTAATVEPGEPGLCSSPPSEKTAWYTYTPAQSGSVTASVSASFAPVAIGVYTGSALSGLTRLACGYGQRVTLHVDAGTTYHLQIGSFGQQGGPLQLNLGVPSPPTASFSFYPSDPSGSESVQFYDYSYDAAQAGFTEAWSFGDGQSAGGGCCPSHRYAVDGDYTARLVITTTDGRTASTQQVVHVRTHDVTITKFSTPAKAQVAQTKEISVGVNASRYDELVRVDLFRNTDSQPFGSLTQSVPAQARNHATAFTFSYTFTAEDGAFGKATFRAVATIVNARDALPADNTAIGLPTRVTP